MDSENSKNPDFKLPIDLPSVTPEDYGKDINSANGSAKKTSGQKAGDGPPDYTLPGFSSGKKSAG